MSHFFQHLLTIYFYFSSLSNSISDCCFWWIFYLIHHIFQLPSIVVIQSLSHFWLSVTQWSAARPGFPVLHCLPDFAQTQVQWVSHAIQPSHPLSPCSTPALNLSHHQGFSNELALHIRWAKYWSFNLNISPSSEHSVLISIRVGWIDLVLQGLCRVFSGTKIQKHQFFGAQPSLWSNFHIHTWLLEKSWLWLCGPLLMKCLCFLIHCLGLS